MTARRKPSIAGLTRQLAAADAAGEVDHLRHREAELAGKVVELEARLGQAADVVAGRGSLSPLYLR